MYDTIWATHAHPLELVFCYKHFLLAKRWVGDEVGFILNLTSPRSDISSWNKNHQKKNFWKNLNKSLYLSTLPINTTYWKSKQLDYNQNNKNETENVERNYPESTQASVSQCKPTNYKYDNDKYNLKYAECKRLVHYGCTSLSAYQLQLFLTNGYRKFMCSKWVKVPSYLHAISLNQSEVHPKTVIKKLERELREQEERLTEVDNPD